MASAGRSERGSPATVPRGGAVINENQIAEIERFFGPTRLFPAVKIGNE
jgi:hypothetical protein